MHLRVAKQNVVVRTKALIDQLKEGVVGGVIADVFRFNELDVGDWAKEVSILLLVADCFFRVHVGDARGPPVCALVTAVFGKLGSLRLDKGNS